MTRIVQNQPEETYPPRKSAELSSKASRGVDLLYTGVKEGWGADVKRPDQRKNAASHRRRDAQKKNDGPRAKRDRTLAIVAEGKKRENRPVQQQKET